MLVNHLPIINNRLPSLLIYSYLLFTFSSYNHFSFRGTTVAAGTLNLNQKKASASSSIGTESESDSQSSIKDNKNNVRTPSNQQIYGEENCKSNKLKELILETIGLFPHQYSYQARYMKEQAENRFGYWWSAVIISEKGGYGMSAVYDQYTNTTCELRIFDTFYWLGRTS